MGGAKGQASGHCVHGLTSHGGFFLPPGFEKTGGDSAHSLWGDQPQPSHATRTTQTSATYSFSQTTVIVRARRGQGSTHAGRHVTWCTLAATTKNSGQPTVPPPGRPRCRRRRHRAHTSSSHHPCSSDRRALLVPDAVARHVPSASSRPRPKALEAQAPIFAQDECAAEI